MIYVVACIGIIYHIDSDAAIYMLSFKYSDSHIILSIRRMIWLSLFFCKLLKCLFFVFYSYSIGIYCFSFFPRPFSLYVVQY